jgi:hypothetical protein
MENKEQTPVEATAPPQSEFKYKREVKPPVKMLDKILTLQLVSNESIIYHGTTTSQIFHPICPNILENISNIFCDDVEVAGNIEKGGLYREEEREIVGEEVVSIEVKVYKVLAVISVTDLDNTNLVQNLMIKPIEQNAD